MTKSHTHTELVGKLVYYRKPKYAWQFGKVKSVVMYTRGPKKGQLRYARIATREYTGKMVERNGFIIQKTRWTGPCRRTDTIYEVLVGKKKVVPVEKWLK